MPTLPRETNHAFHVLAPLDRDSGMRIVGPIGTPNRWRRDDRTEPSNAPADSSMASHRCYHQAGFSTTARHREDPMSKASAGVKTSAVFCCAAPFDSPSVELRELRIIDLLRRARDRGKLRQAQQSGRLIERGGRIGRA